MISDGPCVPSPAETLSGPPPRPGRTYSTTSSSHTNGAVFFSVTGQTSSSQADKDRSSPQRSDERLPPESRVLCRDLVFYD